MARRKWATLDPEPDEWTKQFLSEDAQQTTVGELYVGEDPTRVLASPAPVAPLRPPGKLLGQEKNETTRTLRLRLSSPREAWRAYLLRGPGVEIWGGERTVDRSKKWTMWSSSTRRSPGRRGRDGEGASLGADPVRSLIEPTGCRHTGRDPPAEPGSVMPAPLPPEAEVFAGYPTLVSRSFVFDEGGTP